MEEKLIQVFYGTDCLPHKDKECKVHYPIVGSAFLGASETTKIRFYYSKIGDNNVTWVSEAKRPDGKTGSQVLSKSSDEDGSYAELSLSGWYTQVKGDLYISLKGYQGGVTYQYDSETHIYSITGTPVVQATGAIKLAVNYTPIGDVPDYTDEYTTYQQILAGLGDKIDIEDGIVVIVDATEPSSIYEDGQIAYALTQKRLYRLVSGSWVDYFDAYTKTQTDGLIQDTKDYVASHYVDLSTQQLVNGHKIFGERVTARCPLIVDHQSAGASGGFYMVNALLTTNSKYYFARVGTTDGYMVTYNFPYDYSDVGTKTYVVATTEDVASSIASAIATVKANTFQVVGQLPPTTDAEEGIIYLVPNDSGGYTQYIWEGNQYLNIGDTNIDLSGYVQTSRKVAGYALSSDVTAAQIQGALFNVSVVSITERD